MATTLQEEFWQSEFGKSYTERNKYNTPQMVDVFYKKLYGVSFSEMVKDFFENIKINNILEVGCNSGNQLISLQSLGYNNLYGIDIMPYAVEKAKEYTKNINIIQGSAFDIPFKDAYFDLAFTDGVLIHINPKDIHTAMKEIYRVSKKYIVGIEYFEKDYVGIEYRGEKDKLWKGNFSKMYLDLFPNLKLVKEKFYPNLENPKNIDTMFLLEKV
ncbi:MAG: methyltransferase domain-containing protein [Candidatus Staskawiczbacteria bacterium]|nr:methyltransferase domain-containing protein [Candidatus Staskawiczbacteria bacterium]